MKIWRIKKKKTWHDTDSGKKDNGKLLCMNLQRIIPFFFCLLCLTQQIQRGKKKKIVSVCETEIASERARQREVNGQKKKKKKKN